MGKEEKESYNARPPMLCTTWRADHWCWKCPTRKYNSLGQRLHLLSHWKRWTSMVWGAALTPLSPARSVCQLHATLWCCRAGIVVCAGNALVECEGQVVNARYVGRQ